MKLIRIEEHFLTGTMRAVQGPVGRIMFLRKKPKSHEL